MPTPQPLLNISAVERETGLSKDVLRKWESRYGFPAPARDALGERLYDTDQVDRLRLIKRLLDAGQRPAKVVPLATDALAELAERRHVQVTGLPAGETEAALLAGLRAHDREGLRQLLRRWLLDRGLRHFVLDIAAPLTHAVGEAWARGELEIHEEHLYTEVLQSLLRAAIDDLGRAGGRPRVVLTTPPEEPHSLGLLMVGALLALEGAYCVSLGPQLPLADIAAAARAHRADLVVLSLSIAYQPRKVVPVLAELRERLPADMAIWAGGAGTARLRKGPDGVTLTPDLESLLAQLASWRPGATGPVPL